MKHLTKDGAEAEAMDETERNNTEGESELHMKVKAPYDLDEDKEEIEIEEIFSDDQENNLIEDGEKQGVQPGAEGTKKTVQQPQSWEDFQKEHM